MVCPFCTLSVDCSVDYAKVSDFLDDEWPASGRCNAGFNASVGGLMFRYRCNV